MREKRGKMYGGRSQGRPFYYGGIWGVIAVAGGGRNAACPATSLVYHAHFRALCSICWALGTGTGTGGPWAITQSINGACLLFP